MELYAYGEQVPLTGESSPPGPDKRLQDSTHHGIGGGEFIEPDELRECVAFARAHGQEVVPEVQALSHVYYLACAHGDIAELPDALFPDAYCPSNERSYEILFDVLDEYVDIMGSKTVHIGHDEWRAGGLCPRCRSQHTGDLFAADVIRIYEHLRSRGVGVWMWGDHFASGHNEKGHSHGKDGKVWYDYPSTAGAWEKVRAACPDLVLTNWSWSLKRSERPDDVWNHGRT
jgi:hexosaminidase